MVEILIPRDYSLYAKPIHKVSKYGGRPSLVSAYAKAAALAFEPIGEETGEVSYETSLAQVSPLQDTWDLM